MSVVSGCKMRYIDCIDACILQNNLLLVFKSIPVKTNSLACLTIKFCRTKHMKSLWTGMAKYHPLFSRYLDYVDKYYPWQSDYEPLAVVVVSSTALRCPPINGCSLSRCQFGLERDASGCEICSCNEPCRVSYSTAHHTTVFLVFLRKITQNVLIHARLKQGVSWPWWRCSGLNPLYFASLSLT